MAYLFSPLTLFLICIFIFLSLLVSAELVREDGYTVTTVINGHNVGINPYSVLPRPGSSDLIVLDSSNSVFYSVSLPLSSESEIKLLSGSVDGYSDGDSVSARFKNPKSFAVDLKGNLYVADKKNHVIRKISKSGVSTIAGGYTQSLQTPLGHQDGLAQNATFSSDFDVAFVAKECALLVSDHGNQLVRQINLKAEDCAAQALPGVGAVSVSVLAIGLGLSCLIGVAVGIAIRPYMISSTGRLQPQPLQQDMEALPNQSGETSTDLLLRHQKRNC